MSFPLFSAYPEQGLNVINVVPFATWVLFRADMQGNSWGKWHLVKDKQDMTKMRKQKFVTQYKQVELCQKSAVFIGVDDYTSNNVMSNIMTPLTYWTDDFSQKCFGFFLKHELSCTL